MIDFNIKVDFFINKSSNHSEIKTINWLLPNLRSLCNLKLSVKFIFLLIYLQALEELKGTGQQQRFDRLQTLLNRSNLYATYLLGRIKVRDAEEQSRKEAEEKKSKVIKEKKQAKEVEEKSSLEDTNSQNQKVFIDFIL